MTNPLPDTDVSPVGGPASSGPDRASPRRPSPAHRSLTAPGGVASLGRRPGWWLLLVVVVVTTLAAGIGLRDPWPADEPRFSLIASEMLATGQFWIPHRGGEPYADKPPVFIWLTAAAIAATGSVRAGFLLPSLLAGLACWGLVVDLVRRLHGWRTAWLAGAALATTVLFVLQAKTAQIDMVLVFWTTLCSYGLLRHALLGPAPGWWLVAWAAAGFGIITKGVGFLPLFLVPVWLWLARRQAALAGGSGARRLPGAGPRPVPLNHLTPLTLADLGRGVLALVLATATWGLPMILMATFSGDPALAAYRDNILFRQTGERYVAAWHHVKPWYFYLVEVLPWAWMPLVLALPWAIPAWLRRFRRGDARVILTVSAVILILVFFSVSPGKRGVYILPTIPLLVIALAPLLAGLVARPGLQRLGGVVLALFAAVLLGLGLAGLAGLPALAQQVERHGLDPWAWILFSGLAAVGLLAGLRPRRGLFALALWFPLFWTSYSLWIYPQLNGTRSPAALMSQVDHLTGPGAWLGMPDFDEEFLLQARQPIVHFGRETPHAAQFARAFAWLQAEPDGRWMLTEQRKRDALGCVDLSQAIDLGHQNRDDWWLIPGTAFATCPGDKAAGPLFVVPTSLGTKKGSEAVRPAAGHSGLPAGNDLSGTPVPGSGTGDPP